MSMIPWNATSLLLMIILCHFDMCPASGNLLDVLHVNENINPSTLITDLQDLLLKKGKFSKIELSEADIYSGNKMESLPFAIDKTGKVKLQDPLDREKLCKRNVDSRCNGVCCKILHIQVAINDIDDTTNFYLKIVVMDVNDNSPKFPHIDTPYKEIKEDVPHGFQIKLPKAEDRDSGSFAIQSYNITNWRAGNSSDFQLKMDNAGNPYLSVVQSLDRENNYIYRFTLEAKDGGSPSRTGSVAVQIRIKDVNDNRPQFQKRVYEASVRENENLPHKLFSYKLTDRDEADNGRVDVRIIDAKRRAQNFFGIRELGTDGKSGILELINQIDFEEISKFNFYLEARDRGKPSQITTATVEITIKNVNDNGPMMVFLEKGKYLDGKLDISEDTPSQTTISEMQVTDKDSDLSKIRCDLMHHGDHFVLVERIWDPMATSKQYQLKINTELDREKKRFYMLTVKCSDHDDPKPLEKITVLRIHILDVNDNAPQFTQQVYAGSVPENRDKTLVDFSKPIECNDSDTGKNALLRYKLEDNPENPGDSHSFTIHNSKTQIRTSRALDFETKPQYSFYLIATDQGDTALSSSTSIVINVIDVNDNAPRLLKHHYSFSVSEDAETGKEIGTIVAVDGDTDPANKRIRYKLSGERSDLGLVEINQETGSLRTRQRLDRETKNSINFYVIAENTNPLSHGTIHDSAQASVVVNVEDVNDNRPTFEVVEANRMHVSFTWERMGGAHPECVPLPYRVMDLDNKLDNQECCDLHLKNDYDGMFRLLPDSNRILCAHKKPPKPQRYKITLVARDREGNRSHSAQVQFSVIVKSEPRIHQGNTADSAGLSDNHQVIVIAILASVAGFFCIILFVVILVMRRRTIYKAKERKAKPDIQVVMGSNSGKNTMRRNSCGKLQSEICTLLSQHRMGEAVPEYYSEEDGGCAPDNAYEATMIGGHGTNCRTHRGAETSPRVLSKSCDSVNKSTWRPILHQSVYQLSSDCGGGRTIAGTVGGQQSYYQQALLDTNGYPTTSGSVYQTVQGGGEAGGVVRDDPNDNACYQVIEPYGAYTGKTRPSLYTKASPSMQIKTMSYTGLKPSNTGQSMTTSNPCEEDPIYAPKKSMRNAYFQTSFV